MTPGQGRFGRGRLLRGLRRLLWALMAMTIAAAALDYAWGALARFLSSGRFGG